MLVSREGALPGAADWNHAYGDIANTVKSNDQRVKLPLGLLWFGGNSNLDILPRHGHGPSEQVVGGRLFIEGMNCLSARDVYTGRVLWKRDFEDLGTINIYHDDTYADTPLSTAYNQVHIPGANARGTNYVATEEGVYLVVGSRCLLLDAATGQTLRQFELPAQADGQPPLWAFVGVYENLLLAGTGFGNYSQRLGYQYTPEGKRGVAWSPEYNGSLGLLAFDRKSGAILWRVDATHSFLHNGIVAGGGRIYCLDKLPQRVEDQYRRRGTPLPDYRLLALDAASGKLIWQRTEKVFGTWLGYSQEQDILLQAGAAAGDRSPDEVATGMATYRARRRRPVVGKAGPEVCRPLHPPQRPDHHEPDQLQGLAGRVPFAGRRAGHDCPSSDRGDGPLDVYAHVRLQHGGGERAPVDLSFRSGRLLRSDDALRHGQFRRLQAPAAAPT